MTKTDALQALKVTIVLSSSATCPRQVIDTLNSNRIEMRRGCIDEDLISGKIMSRQGRLLVSGEFLGRLVRAFARQELTVRARSSLGQWQDQRCRSALGG